MGDIVDDIQHPEALPVSELVADEVERPACVGPDLPLAHRQLTKIIERLTDERVNASKKDTELRWLCTVPKIDPVTPVSSHRISQPSAAGATLLHGWA